MSVQTGSVVAATSAVILYKNDSYNNHQVTFTTHNNSADILVGGSNVTPTNNGVTFAKSLIYQLIVPAGETLYCAGNGTDTIKWLTFTDD